MNGSLVDKLEGESGLYECIQKYDCVFMSETWTNESCDVDVKGFISFCKHRKRKKGLREIREGWLCTLRKT